MLLDKVTNYFEEIKTLIDDSPDFDSLASQYIKLYHSDLCIREDCRTKYSRNTIITLFVLFKLFATGTIYNTVVKSDFRFIVLLGKDVLYKIKNSPLINWRALLLKTAANGLKGLDFKHDVYRPWTLPCFIIDDTDLVKRGRTIEFIGKIFSHVSHSCNLGFKSLNLCYWSGKNLLHLDFTMHKEMGKEGNQGLSKHEQKRRFAKKRAEDTWGYKRTMEAHTKKSDQAVNMLRRAIGKGFTAAYILCDSWFFCTKLIEFCLDNNLNLVSRPKFNNWKYTFEGLNYTIGDLVKKMQHKKGYKKWNKELKMHYMRLPVCFGGCMLTLFFYKDKRRNSPWQAIVTTDKQIGAIQAYKIYQNRWAIEVSFKELKQHLGYGKCQSRDFDRQISDATHTLMAYNYLSHLKALQNYTTIGGIFAEVSKQWVKPSIMDRFWNHIYTIMAELAEIFEISLNDLIDKLNTDISLFSKCKLILARMTTETRVDN